MIFIIIIVAILLAIYEIKNDNYQYSKKDKYIYIIYTLLIVIITSISTVKLTDHVAEKLVYDVNNSIIEKIKTGTEWFIPTKK